MLGSVTVADPTVRLAGGEPAGPGGMLAPVTDRQRPEPVFRERLWPGPLGWVAAVALAALLGLALLPVDGRLAAVVGVVAVAAALVGTVLTTPRVEVAGGELRAGPAHVPLTLLGPARPLAGAELRAELGPLLDARAYLCLRGWLRRAVRVELVDPRDPPPYWIVSPRRPDRLAAALSRPGGTDGTR